MKGSTNQSFIFFLNFEDKISNIFFVLQKKFKREDIDLIPVKIDQLQVMRSMTTQPHLIVISSVTNVKEANLYQKKVRKLLKYLLKSKRMSFILLSSFEKLSDYNLFSFTGCYHFLRYPLRLNLFSQQMIEYYKNQESLNWPGGTLSDENKIKHLVKEKENEL